MAFIWRGQWKNDRVAGHSLLLRNRLPYSREQKSRGLVSGMERNPLRPQGSSDKFTILSVYKVSTNPYM